MSKKRGWLALALALVLLLSGCTYQKKADEAAKLIEEGKYAEAYEIYKDLEERTLMEETKDKAFQAAQEGGKPVPPVLHEHKPVRNPGDFVEPKVAEEFRGVGEVGEEGRRRA